MATTIYGSNGFVTVAKGTLTVAWGGVKALLSITGNIMEELLKVFPKIEKLLKTFIGDINSLIDELIGMINPIKDAVKASYNFSKGFVKQTLTEIKSSVGIKDLTKEGGVAAATSIWSSTNKAPVKEVVNEVVNEEGEEKAVLIKELKRSFKAAGITVKDTKFSSYKELVESLSEAQLNILKGVYKKEDLPDRIKEALGIS